MVSEVMNIKRPKIPATFVIRLNNTYTFMKNLITFCLCLLAYAASAQEFTPPVSWSADNGNGTYTNPLFYDEFSDPDIIRVGDDFYLAGTTMHCTPGIVILHSKDLVNWKFMSYCMDRFDMGDEFNLENEKEAYGQGIWAPCIRYHNGKFYVFSNINGHGLQVFIAENPAGPWKHINTGVKIYDLSVLFDDNGKIYAVYQYNEVHLIEMKPDFSGFVEGSEKVIIPAGNAMGEGHHFYKINGKYYIISANYSPVGRMQCARADRPEGPYETVTISMRETMGTQCGHLVGNVGLGSSITEEITDFKVSDPSGSYQGAATLHQGGIVDLPNGDWWGFSMQDFRSLGRTTCLSPVTWVDGWPYFGLPGNLGRTPRTWFKPDVEAETEPCAPYQRSDNFNGKKLLPIWQWNHNPNNKMWSLSKGQLNLRTLPAPNLLWAKNTLTQRCIGPVSTATVTLDVSQLKNGDIAGLGILNIPYLYIGIKREGTKNFLEMRSQQQNENICFPFEEKNVYLRITTDLDNDTARLAFSRNGTDFETVGKRYLLPYQLKTFQGARYALFAYNVKEKNGGRALFDNFTVEEPMADRRNNLPTGKVISLKNLGNGTYAWANPHGMLHSAAKDSPNYKNQGCFFKVHDRGQGRVVLEAMNGTGFLTVVGAGLSSDVRLMKQESEGSLFLWQDMLRGQCMLLSLKTQRYVGMDPATGEPYGADWTGCRPDRKDGTVFEWKEIESDGIVRPTETPNIY